MAKKTRRTVDDIFDDLDNIGKRKPSMAELYPEEFESQQQEEAAARIDEDARVASMEELQSSDEHSFASPPNRKQSRVEGNTSRSTIAVTPTPHQHLTGGSTRLRTNQNIVTPVTVCGGSPALSDAFSVDSSPAFASELTTKHRKAEEAADLAVYLADSMWKSPGYDGLEHLVKHLTATGVRYVLRSLRIAGLLRQFLKGFLNDQKYHLQRSPSYQQTYLSLLHAFVEHVPHDAVPIDETFKRLIEVLTPSAAVNPPLVADAPTRTKSSGGLAASAAIMALKQRATATTAKPVVVAQGDDSNNAQWIRTAVGQLVTELDHATQSQPTDSQSPLLGNDAHPLFEGSSAAEAFPKAELLVLTIVTNLLLSHNQQAQLQVDGFTVRSLSNVISKSAAVLFLEAGGVTSMLQFLRHNEGQLTAGKSSMEDIATTVLAAFRLLVLVTCDAETAHTAQRDTAILESLEALLEYSMHSASTWLKNASSNAASVNDAHHQTSDLSFEAIRVVINLTSVLPQLIPSSARSLFLQEACAWARQYIHLLDPSAVVAEEGSDDNGTDDFYDNVTLSICLAINLLRRGANVEAVRCLTENNNLASASALLHAAKVMVYWYESGDTRQSVLSGYIAMLLACISLCTGSSEDYRVAVITAITKGIASKSLLRGETQLSLENSQDSHELHCAVSRQDEAANNARKLRAKPMMLVVAILQEFVLFQSSAGILTKEVLLSMHHVVEKLIQQNHIVVERGDDD